jgi:hypothetical protein
MEFSIDHYGWGQTGPFPTVTGSITANENGYAIRFDVVEDEIRAANYTHNGRVCEDSCAEFFCRPYGQDPRYINIEINPIGAVHFGVGEGRHNRILLADEYIRAMGVRTNIDRSGAAARWQVCYTLPYGMIAEIFGAEPILPGNAIFCNFDKCGDKLQKPHWGSWASVNTEQPDFHRPEFFEKIIL